jgi:glyceraldehyde 3-phosphate dehydrogenase
MAVKVGINGYGRIGRNILRALYEAAARMKSRSWHQRPGRRAGQCAPDALRHRARQVPRQGQRRRRFDGRQRRSHQGARAQRDPAQIPWGALGADVVLECTGFFTTKAEAGKHMAGGAKKVVISAPGGKDVDATVVYGVNHNVLKSTHTVISNASCTTNCLAPLAKVLNDGIGIQQRPDDDDPRLHQRPALTDVYHEDIRRARSATMSMIPAKTGAAAAVGLVLPELKGKLDGFAIRVPTINVSLVDLTFTPKRATTIEEINNLVKAAASSGPLKGSWPTPKRRWCRSTTTTTRLRRPMTRR